MLRLCYVPGGHGSPVCSKRSVPWNFGHTYISVFILNVTSVITSLSFLALYYDIRNKSW